MDEADIAVGGFVVSGGQPSGVLELVKASFDHVARGADVGIDRQLDKPVAFGRDHRSAATHSIISTTCVESLGIPTFAFGVWRRTPLQLKAPREGALFQLCDNSTPGVPPLKWKYGTHAAAYLQFCSLERALIIFVKFQGFASGASSRFQQRTDLIVTEFPFAYPKPPPEPFLPPRCGLDN